MKFTIPAQELPRSRSTIIGILSILAVVIVYTLITAGPLFPAEISPTWDKMLRVGYQWFTTDFLSDLIHSCLRLVAGLSLALLASIPLGIAIALVPEIRAALWPIVSSFRYIPPPALLPLLVILAGVGNVSKVLIITIAIIFVVIPTVVDAISSLPIDTLRIGQSLGIHRFALVRYIIIPAVLPDISLIVRNSIGIAWTYVIVSELINSSNGLGFRIVVSQRFLRIDLIIVVLLVIGLLGIGSDWLMGKIHRQFFPWKLK